MEKEQEQKLDIENFEELRKVFCDRGLTLSDLDKMAYFYSKAFEQNTKHNSPSPETRTNFKNMTEELTKIKIDQVEIKADVKSIKENLYNHTEKEDETFARLEKIVADFMNTTDQKFAGKWLETLVVRLGWIIMTPLVGGALFLVWEIIKIYINHK